MSRIENGGRARPILGVVAIATATVLALAGAAHAATSITIDFTAPGYAVGPASPVGQNGWGSVGSTTDWDFGLADNATFPASGLDPAGRSLRVSNAAQPGTRTLRSPIIESAGEPGLPGAVGNTFTARYTVASATGALQPGLRLDVPIDASTRYGGVVNLQHTADGLAIGSYWVPQTASDASNSSWRSAVFTTVDPTVPHTIEVSTWFLSGQADVMQVTVDGVVVSAGSGASTWKRYYEIVGLPADRVVDEINFRTTTSAPTADGIGFQTGLPAAPATSGLGFLFTDIGYEVTTSSPPLPVAPPPVPPAPDPVPDTTLALDSPVVAPAGSVAFTAAGFLPYEAVYVTIFQDSASGGVGAGPGAVSGGWFEADASGTVSGSITVPAEFGPGSHPLQATGSVSGWTAVGEFDVAATPPAPEPAPAGGDTGPVSGSGQAELPAAGADANGALTLAAAAATVGALTLGFVVWRRRAATSAEASGRRRSRTCEG